MELDVANVQGLGDIYGPFRSLTNEVGLGSASMGVWTQFSTLLIVIASRCEEYVDAADVLQQSDAGKVRDKESCPRVKGSSSPRPNRRGD